MTDLAAVAVAAMRRRKKDTTVTPPILKDAERERERDECKM